MIGPTKPTIPDVIDRFRAYHDEHPMWRSLHVVLDDQNVEDHFIEHCMAWAMLEDDLEGVALAFILAAMSRTQRLKISRLA